MTHGFLTDSDPGDEQPEPLFDPATTEAPRCPSCGAGHRHVCAHQAAISRGELDALSRRPRGCLASGQLGPNDDLPY